MDEQSVLTQEVDPKTVADDQAQPDQVTEPAEGEAKEGEPEKSPAKERREREQKAKRDLWEAKTRAEERAQEAEGHAAHLKEIMRGEKAPREQDFPDPLEYAAMRAVYLSNQSQFQRQVTEAEHAAQNERESAQKVDDYEKQVTAAAWQAQVAEAKGRYADFETVAYNAPISDAVAKLVASSDAGADIAYHLGKNPEQAALLSSMPPIEAARAIGRLEASIAQPVIRPATNAPPPINPVRGSMQGGKTPEAMNMEEYIAARKSGAIR